jgi:hypothetical protein
MFHILARDYGWTIDEIANLSMTQIHSLLRGRKLVEEEQKKTPGKKGGKNSIDDPRQLFGLPGVNLSAAAKKKIRTAAKKE